MNDLRVIKKYKCSRNTFINIQEYLEEKNYKLFEKYKKYDIECLKKHEILYVYIWSDLIYTISHKPIYFGAEQLNSINFDRILKFKKLC